MKVGVLVRLIVAMVCTVFLTAATAQEWPAQAVRIVVPYAPGGAVDMMARALAERLGQRWKQSVIVENRAGGSEVIAATTVARAKPDGYTLFLATDIGLETNPFLFTKLPYNPQTDFTPITRLAEGPLIYVVKADSPIRTLNDLIALAKQQPAKISYGSSGTGGSIHLATNWLGIVAGNVQFVHVPYKGSAPTMTDTLAGVLDFTAAPLSVVAPYVAEKRMRAIATSGSKRVRTLPEVPSFTDLGFKEAVTTFMFGLVGPAKLAPELASRIAADVGVVMREPEMKEKNVDAYGFELAVETPQAFAQYLASNRENQRARVRAANVQLD